MADGEGGYFVTFFGQLNTFLSSIVTMIVLVFLFLLGSASSFAPVHHRFIGARIALNDVANGDFSNGDSKALLFGKLLILVPFQLMEFSY
jgi:hypothetical protein